ncbi:hypothetical protein BCR41DRAFT_364080 [Lobosporangium transversale]|uniref:ZFAND1-like ubiquitin-like domain-containing protein n=1 Tax=Lobosporangium transversale TaxID=64571 RepID=A0A1Y2G6R3_9FUNG|nr:hypothetical protein BCR41DRAFT_364080 [Lobosporangium transversale]ORY98420.1 hypothetical protein BCR41DRAFT_364080 [Lobosporangium transversale]|eukprot:XP_021875791.1 hypothetical protein BCR41DRAFT_364080 [Lobosporangium transversale]
MVSVLKLIKSAQGEDKIPLNSRLYLHIRSPLYPQLNDKAVFVDKTWTVGRSLDKITEWFKITPPMNMHQSFDANKRLSIFHAKEPEDVPKLLAMQDRLQQLPSVESADTVYLAPADWDYSDL